MTYATVATMVVSASLKARLAAAAAAEGQAAPAEWANLNMWALVSQPGWAAAWAYAEDTSTVNDNPDTGQRDDVINDGMILAGVQAVLAAV